MLDLLFSPHGSITRKPFILGLISSFVLVWIVFIVFELALTASHARLPIVDYAGFCAAIVFGLWMNTCLTLKRLSDLRVTRWLMVIPIVGAYAARFLPPTMLLIVIHGIIGIAFFLFLLLWPSRSQAY